MTFWRDLLALVLMLLMFISEIQQPTNWFTVQVQWVDGSDWAASGIDTRIQSERFPQGVSFDNPSVCQSQVTFGGNIKSGVIFPSYFYFYCKVQTSCRMNLKWQQF